MKGLKYTASAAAFVILTVLKLCIPGAGETIRTYSGRIIDRNTDYKSAVSYIQAKWNKDEGEASTAKFAGPDEAAKEPALPYHLASVEELRQTTLPEVKHVSHEEQTAVAAQNAEAETNAHQAAVDAFKASQAAFTDFAIPTNVTCDYEALPFTYTSPVTGSPSSGFGFRLHPILNAVKFHYGTDMAANSGEPICAFADGTVLTAAYSDSFGYYMTVDHGDGWQTLYAHCSSLAAESGEKVCMGQTIGYVGATGQATGPHLHFELTRDGIYLNPEYYVNYVCG